VELRALNFPDLLQPQLPTGSQGEIGERARGLLELSGRSKNRRPSSVSSKNDLLPPRIGSREIITGTDGHPSAMILRMISQMRRAEMWRASERHS